MGWGRKEWRAYGSGDAPVWAVDAGGELVLDGGRWTAHDLRIEFGTGGGSGGGGGGGGGGDPEPPAAPVLLQ